MESMLPTRKRLDAPPWNIVWWLGYWHCRCHTPLIHICQIQRYLCEKLTIPSRWFAKHHIPTTFLHPSILLGQWQCVSLDRNNHSLITQWPAIPSSTPIDPNFSKCISNTGASLPPNLAPMSSTNVCVVFQICSTWWRLSPPPTYPTISFHLLQSIDQLWQEPICAWEQVVIMQGMLDIKLGSTTAKAPAARPPPSKLCGSPLHWNDCSILAHCAASLKLIWQRYSLTILPFAHIHKC